jgi:molybdopterin converting factor subunit 1
MVTVKVLYFASIREAVGKREETLVLVQSGGGDTAFTLADVRRRLGELYPDARDAIEHITLARNLEYSPDDTRVADGDEVALIPPISGG